MSLAETQVCRAFAPAKINLTLAVGAQRADGYHPVDSLVAFADWGDEIEVRESADLVLHLTGHHAETLRAEPENLVLKAAFALRAAAERPGLAAALTLKKTLPVASGIGGGSSDAAATLRALNIFWDLNFSSRQLAEIGSVIGADVPACVHARPLRMTGIGERVTPLVAWPELHGVIANAGVGLSTAAVFRAYDATGPGALVSRGPVAAGGIEAALDLIAGGANDLEAAALGLQPLIGQTLQALQGLPEVRLVRMSGSGASCFALFATAGSAQDGADRLKAAHPDWTVAAVRLGGAA